MSKQGFPLGTAGMALIIVVGGLWAFERVLRWSDSDQPLETLADGADRIRDLEASMGEQPAEGGDAGGPAYTDPVHAPAEGDRSADQPADTSPVMDLEHLTERDLLFLQEVLAGDDPEARLSAARALVISGHPAAIPMLFEAASRPGEDMDLFCLAALDVARLHQQRDVLVELLLAMEHQPPLSTSCRAEVDDRFALIGGRDPATMAGLHDDPEPRLRAWVVRLLADEEGQAVDEILVARVSDEDPRVRSRAWSAWGGRDLEGSRAELQAAAEAEADPEIAARAVEVLGR